MEIVLALVVVCLTIGAVIFLTIGAMGIKHACGTSPILQLIIIIAIVIILIKA